jgi:hypothetical protein
MSVLSLNYPHDRQSFEPRNMTARTIWTHAAAIRKQLDPRIYRPQFDLDRMIDRSSRIVVNGRQMQAHWECNQRIHDDDAVEVLGATEFDPACPGAVMVYVNGVLIDQQTALLRSTACHELAHVIYDAPAWLQCQHPIPKRLQYRVQSQRRRSGAIDWREWRANEFMGALLVPPDQLRKMLVRHASANEFKFARVAGGHPVVDQASTDPMRIDAIFEDIGESFGVSAKFIEVRVKKYGLIQ